MQDSSAETSSEISKAIRLLSNAEGGDERGAIFTRRPVVDFMLDLVGYTSDQPLHQPAVF